MADPKEEELRTSWNGTVGAWAIGLVLGLAATVAVGIVTPSLTIRSEEGGPGLLLLLLLLFLLPLEWIAVSTAVSWLSLRMIGRAAPGLPPDTVRACSSFRWGIDLENRSPVWPALFLRVLQRLEDDRGGSCSTEPRRIALLRPKERSRLEWEFVLRRRGKVRLAESVAEVGLPGSLIRGTRAFPVDRAVTVLPLLFKISQEVLEVLTGRRQSSSSRMNLVPAGAEEFVGVRLYRPGDSPRFVNFPLSLRLADYPYDLVVREFEDPGQEDVCLLLDSVVPPVGPDQAEFAYRFERAVSFADSLVRLLVARKYRVRLVTLSAGGLIDRTAGVRQGDVGSLERALSEAQPVTDLDRYHGACRGALASCRAPLLLLSLRDHRNLSSVGRPAVVLGSRRWEQWIEGVDVRES